MAGDPLTDFEARLNEKFDNLVNTIKDHSNVNKGGRLHFVSIFAAILINVTILAGFYFTICVNHLDKSEFDKDMREHKIQELERNYHVNKRVYELEIEVKKIKEHRIGRMGDEGPK